MTGHSSHFKVVHNKHASSSKRRLPSSDSGLTSRESDDILDVEASLGPLEVGLEIENDGSVELEVNVGDVKAEVEVTPRDAKEGVLKKRAEATRSDACDTGAFYTAPTIGSTHDSLKPLTVSWDPALNCLSSTLLDIYLYAPHSTSPRIHLWSRVKVARGKMDVEIMPRWWNATSSEELQIQIVESGKPPFLSNLPAGPVFTATYEAPTDGTTLTVADTSVVDIGETRVNDDVKASSSKGKIAAGILVPLLFIAIGLAFFLRWKRAKSLADRKKWTEAVDKRMSTISTDWKSVTGKGAQEAIRKSFAAGNRASTFSFNGGVGGRPSSQWANDEWNEKGGDGGDLGAQKRPGVGLRNPASLSGTGERVSRVSFADGPRPSSESRRTKVMRDSYVPPVPSLPTVATPDTSYTSYGEKEGSEEGTGSGAMSPTQTQGAFSLTPEAIRARIAAGRARSGSNASAGTGAGGGMGGQGGVKGSVDIGGEETLAALSMMRTGAAGASTDDLLFAAPAAPPQAYSSPLAGNSVVASPIAPSYNTTAPLNLHQGHGYSSGNGMSSPTVSSPVMSSIPMPAMQAMPAAVMSPDDMLRAYAERKKSMSAVSASHGSSSSLSQSTYGTSSAYNTYGTSNVNGVAYPAMPAPAAASGRTLFNGNTVSPQHSGEKKERTPSLGFAPGEYDPNFTFQHGEQQEDAYGGMDGGNGNAAGRGAWRS